MKIEEKENIFWTKKLNKLKRLTGIPAHIASAKSR